MPHQLLLHFCRLASLIVLVALGSCRSEQVAFQFRPAGNTARPIVAQAQPTTTSALRYPALVAASPAPAVASSVPAAATAPPTLRRQPRQHMAVKQLSVRRPLLAASRSLLPKSAAASKPNRADRHETRHLLIGLAVVAAGVVTGLLLGGWLGLGVGALIVIVGYYFLGMAFGGEHAWLEVFQEFFNM